MKPTSLAFSLLIGLSGISTAEAQVAPQLGTGTEEIPVPVPRVSDQKYKAIADDAAWMKTFVRLKAVQKAASSVGSWRVRDVSAPPAPKFAVKRNYYERSPAGEIRPTDLWIVESAGKKARRIEIEAQNQLGAVCWSPDGKSLAYVEKPKGRLFVVDAKSLRKTLIAEGTVALNRSPRFDSPNGVGAPRWTEDGLGLLFWQEKEAGKGEWQAHRATNVSQQPKQELVSDLVANQPGVFSPDGRRMAIPFGYGVLVETLSTHRRSQHSLHGPFQTTDLKWSPDSQWLYLRVSNVGSEYGGGGSYVLNPASEKRVKVDRSLGVISLTEGSSEYIEVRSGEWLPGAGHRLLVFAHNTAPIRTGSGMEPITKLEQRFLIYDADTGTTFEVEGMPQRYNGPHSGGPTITRASDGRSLLIDGATHRFEVAH